MASPLGYDELIDLLTYLGYETWDDSGGISDHARKVAHALKGLHLPSPMLPTFLAKAWHSLLSVEHGQPPIQGRKMEDMHEDVSILEDLPHWPNYPYMPMKHIWKQNPKLKGSPLCGVMIAKSYCIPYPNTGFVVVEANMFSVIDGTIKLSQLKDLPRHSYQTLEELVAEWTID